MNNIESACCFDEIIKVIPLKLQTALKNIPQEIKATTYEIRLRINKPVLLSTSKGNIFITNNSTAAHLERQGLLVAKKSDIDDTYMTICGYSLHAHQDEIRDGYITIKGGHRVGICGTAVTDKDELTTIKNVSSLNLRIAKQISGCAEKIVINMSGKLSGVLIAGAPASGKTTILRDLSRQIANGALGQIYRVCVIDERDEIAATYLGEPQNDIGISCDVMSSINKIKGMEMAIRSLSPDVIICDEIGLSSETNALKHCVNCGVKIIASIHATSIKDLTNKPDFMSLILSGAFEKIVLLDGFGEKSNISEIMETEMLDVEGSRNFNSFYNNFVNRDNIFTKSSISSKGTTLDCVDDLRD